MKIIIGIAGLIIGVLATLYWSPYEPNCIYTFSNTGIHRVCGEGWRQAPDSSGMIICDSYEPQKKDSYALIQSKQEILRQLKNETFTMYGEINVIE